MASPTIRASNIWKIEGGDDILQVLGSGNAVLGGINSQGAGFGALAGGGSGTPGGADTQLQYNNNGVFGGIPIATYIGAASALEIIDPNLIFVAISGSTQANEIQLSPSGLVLNATESGSTVQINSDANIDINSNNGNVSIGATGGFNLNGASVDLTATGRISFLSSAATPKYNFSALPVFANNAAAVTGGLIVGDFYRTGANPDPVCVVH